MAQESKISVSALSKWVGIIITVAALLSTSMIGYGTLSEKVANAADQLEKKADKDRLIEVDRRLGNIENALLEVLKRLPAGR